MKLLGVSSYLEEREPAGLIMQSEHAAQVTACSCRIGVHLSKLSCLPLHRIIHILAGIRVIDNLPLGATIVDHTA